MFGFREDLIRIRRKSCINAVCLTVYEGTLRFWGKQVQKWNKKKSTNPQALIKQNNIQYVFLTKQHAHTKRLMFKCFQRLIKEVKWSSNVKYIGIFTKL